jgi:hypothetical protein
MYPARQDDLANTLQSTAVLPAMWRSANGGRAWSEPGGWRSIVILNYLSRAHLATQLIRTRVNVHIALDGCQLAICFETPAVHARGTVLPMMSVVAQLCN